MQIRYNYDYSPAPPPAHLPQYQGDSLQNELHAWYGHTVAKGFVTGGIGSGWDVCPPVWETLQTLTLKGRQAANQVCVVHDALVVADILVAYPLVVGANQRSNRLLVGLNHQICGLLVLAGAFGADYSILSECIHPLAAVDRMITSRDRIGDVLLTAQAVFRLPVNGIAGDTVDFWSSFHQGNIVPTCTTPGRQC